MVRPDMEKWGQTLADLRVLSVEAKDARSRERFLALYMIADKQTSACVWARTIGTHQGDSAQMGTCLQSVGAGGRVLSSYGWTSPFFSREQVKQLVNVICETEPVEHGLPGHGWTLKKLRRWLSSHELRSRPQHAAPDSASSAVALEKVPESAQESRPTETCGLYGTLSRAV